MVDITSKSNTFRKAIAEAVVHFGSLKTIDTIEQKQVPKGDVFEMSKAAALLGVKKQQSYFLTAIHYLLNQLILVTT